MREILSRESVAGAFCEIPGNPLLGSADVRCISPLLRQNGIPLIADDVVATPVNVDLGRYADLIATSLTTLGGFAPLVVWGGAFWAPLAITIAGGVSGATGVCG